MIALGVGRVGGDRTSGRYLGGSDRFVARCRAPRCCATKAGGRKAAAVAASVAENGRVAEPRFGVL